MSSLMLADTYVFAYIQEWHFELSAVTFVCFGSFNNGVEVFTDHCFGAVDRFYWDFQQKYIEGIRSILLFILNTNDYASKYQLVICDHVPLVNSANTILSYRPKCVWKLYLGLKDAQNSTSCKSTMLYGYKQIIIWS